MLIEWQHGTTAEVIVVESFIEQDGFTAHIKFSPIMPLIDTVCYMWYIGTKTIEQQIKSYIVSVFQQIGTEHRN